MIKTFLEIFCICFISGSAFCFFDTINIPKHKLPINRLQKYRIRHGESYPKVCNGLNKLSNIRGTRGNTVKKLSLTKEHNKFKTKLSIDLRGVTLPSDFVPDRNSISYSIFCTCLYPYGPPSSTRLLPSDDTNIITSLIRVVMAGN